VERCEEWECWGLVFIAARGLDGRGWTVASANRWARADVGRAARDDVVGHASARQGAGCWLDG
jgi:hypothetical protein